MYDPPSVCLSLYLYVRQCTCLSVQSYVCRATVYLSVLCKIVPRNSLLYEVRIKYVSVCLLGNTYFYEMLIANNYLDGHI